MSLFADGTVTVEYGSVLSEDILVGLFDGTHLSDQYLSVQSSYSGYEALGSGVILFDFHNTATIHAGELNGQTITFSP